MDNGSSRLDATHISAAAVQQLFDNVARIGVDIDKVVQRAGAPQLIEKLRARRLPSIPRMHFAPVYRAAMMELQLHVCQDEGKVPTNYDEFELLCHCVITSRTLGEAMVRTVRFFDMLDSRDVGFELRVSGAQAAFVMDTHRKRNTLPTFLLDLAGLAYFYQLYSWLIGEPLELHDAGMAYDAAIARGIVVPEIFSHPIRFDAGDNHLAFPARLLDRPVVRSPDELAERLQSLSFDLMPMQWASARVSDQLATIIRGALLQRTAVPTLAEAARLLNQSSATLRRHLAREHSSARRIRERCLLELAQSQLAGSKDSIEDISARLGFSAPSAFRRAYRQWTGTSPSAFRAASTGAALP